MLITQSRYSHSPSWTAILNNICSILIKTAYHVCPLGVLQGHSKGLPLNRLRDNCQSCVVLVLSHGSALRYVCTIA